MADASRPPPSLPSDRGTPEWSRHDWSGPDWSRLFAALPQETPPAAAWSTIASRLDARAQTRARARRRTHLTLGLAAGLCALAALPLAWRMRETPSPATPQPSAPSLASTGATATAPSEVAPTAQPTPDADAVVATAAASSAAASMKAPSTARTASVRAAPRATARPAWPEAVVPADTLESLYAESAQLESLLALARDPRVESGPAAALASAYEADLALIDASLAEPGLDASARRTLWRARVDALQAASRFEAQQRLLAAEGRRYEGALVSVD
ncbi:MAG: hypothetical protein ACOY82_17875 [Pseudomonadota bacterium]